MRRASKVESRGSPGEASLLKRPGVDESGRTLGKFVPLSLSRVHAMPGARAAHTPTVHIPHEACARTATSRARAARMSCGVFPAETPRKELRELPVPLCSAPRPPLPTYHGRGWMLRCAGCTRARASAASRGWPATGRGWGSLTCRTAACSCWIGRTRQGWAAASSMGSITLFKM